MTYIFPPSLHPLRDYLRSKGYYSDSVKTARQAGFMAQQLMGSRIKFPPQGHDMTATLLEIQKAIPAEDAKADASKPTTPASLRPAAKWAKPVGDKPSVRESNSFECDISSGIHVFADGAAVPNPGEGGWGVVVYRDAVEIEAIYGGDPATTNNKMEMTALLNAIEVAKRLGGPVTIWCDSQYCVNGVNDWRHKWKRHGWKKSPSAKELVKNPDLWQSIDEAMTSAAAAQVTINWVKGHAGIVGNERADELAEAGRQEASGLLKLRASE